MSIKMKPAPRVSIVMPLYNKRPYVRRCVESVLAQTFPDFELIIVDDGSDDGSIFEIPRHDARIKLCRQRNAGPSSARNKGIAVSTGTWVTFIDADNYYAPDKLEQELAALSSTPHVHWMVSPFVHVRHSQKRFRPILDQAKKRLADKPLVVADAVRQLHISDWHIEGVVIHRRLLDHVGGFSETMRCYEITEFIVRCALARPRVLVWPDPLYTVVDVPDSAFKQSSHRVEGFRQLGESFRALSARHPEYAEPLMEMSNGILLTYAGLLILSGQRRQARAYLFGRLSHARNRRWWKMMVSSLLPQGVIGWYGPLTKKANA